MAISDDGALPYQAPQRLVPHDEFDALSTGGILEGEPGRCHVSQSVITRTDPDALVPTVVLYDVMREVANRLRGELVYLERENPDKAAQLLQARIDVSRRADAVDPQDRAAIAAADAQFRAELAALQAA